MNPPNKPASEISQAVTQAVQQTAEEQQAANPTNTFEVSGQIFFNVCSYVGRKPLREVVTLRRGLWELQKAANCLNPAALPAKVTIAEANVGVLMEWLSNQPCDEVFDLMQAFEQELIAYTNQRIMEEAARQTVANAANLADEPAGEAVMDVVATEVPAGSQDALADVAIGGAPENAGPAQQESDPSSYPPCEWHTSTKLMGWALAIQEPFPEPPRIT